MAFLKTMNKKARTLAVTSFWELGQTYVNIMEETANVYFTVSKVREAFRDERLELFTSNGLNVNDNDGTRSG